MQPNSANEFLPVTTGSRSHEGRGAEDDFDVASFSAIRKQQKDELGDLDQQYSSRNAAIETQVRAEVDQLFQQFQLGMQQLYTNLTKTIDITVDNQVQLRLRQEQLRREHEAKKDEVEARYHNEASKLIISTSHVGRHPKPPSVPSQDLGSSQNVISSSTSRPSNFSLHRYGHHVSPVPSSVNGTPPDQQRVPQRSLTSDDMPREHVLPQAPRKEYLAPLPTPMPTPEDLVSHQRRLVAPQSRHAEPRAIEPRPAETRAAETRVEPRVDTLLADPSAQPRQVEHRIVAPRQAEQHHVGQRVEQPVRKQHGFEKGRTELRPVKRYHAEHHTEQHPAEINHVGLHIEQRSALQDPAEQQVAEQRQLETRPIEPRPAQRVTSGLVHEEPRHMDQDPPASISLHQASEHISRISAMTPSRQEGKRKAADIPSSERTNVVPSSKRPRTRERPADLEEDRDTQSPLNRSPRSTRRSSGVAKEPRIKTIKRTIAFKDVYQDGKAQFKHKIFAWPRDSDDWYIVRCDEHQVHFNNGNPIHGAAKHVHSPQHGQLEKRHDLAMEICGHLVLDCNAELAALNNREFERALKEDKYQVFNMNLLTKEGRRRLTDGPVHTADAFGSPCSTSTFAKKNSKPPAKPNSEITRPEECKFYLGFWAPTKKWYMLIVLPIRPDGSLRDVGLKEKIQQTDLMSNVPKCYRSDRISLRITGWQPAYSDGGAKADKREYPVMFFDSPVQKHSVGWLPAAKLKPVDLYNPPDDADKKGLAMARDWYAMRMMHRKDWEQLKRLGPGEPPSPTTSEGDAGKSEHLTSLRSAHIDDMSPIRDKSNGPGRFFGSGSSEEGSDAGDAEDPMTMDIGPIPEPADSNYVEDHSGTDDSEMDVEMKDAAPKSDVNDVIRPGRRATTSRPGSRRSMRDQETSWEKDNAETANATASKTDALQSNSATPPTEDEKQLQAIAVPDQEHYTKSAQAKAVAAVKVAASRSRASSEIPETLARCAASPVQQRPAGATAGEACPKTASLPPMANRSQSGSDGDPKHLASSGTGEPREEASKSDLHTIVKKDQGSTEAGTKTDTHVDPYQRFEAIRAQMNGLSSRPASVPVGLGNGTDSPFGDPPHQSVQTNEIVSKASQQPLTGSPIMSPPLSQSSAMMPARSSSSTPTNASESGRNTPKIVIPENTSRWKMVHSSSSDSVQQTHASFTSKSTSPVTTPLQSSVQPLVQPTPQLGTPIHDKQEIFDVSEFCGPQGISWSRENPNEPFLRLITDPMRKWAETARESDLRANIEPAQVEWIETDHPEGDRDKQRVKLMTKHNHEILLIFETNSVTGRSQKAALQGRRFVSWVKRINEKVEWRDETVGSGCGSRQNSSTNERPTIVVE